MKDGRWHNKEKLKDAMKVTAFNEAWADRYLGVKSRRDRRQH